MASVILKSGREKALRRRHPWIFSGAIAAVEGSPKSGETVEILAQERTRLARGAYSPRSQITVRVWTFNPDEEITPAFFRERLKRAIAYRRTLTESKDLTAVRLVHSESDGLPGLIVDRYGNFLVCQFMAAGSEYWKQEIVAQIKDLIPCAGIYERSDLDVREKEGLPRSTGVLAGDAPPDLIEIQEGECRFLVDILHGHKTGFYLDQRDNRALAAEYARGREVLNGFAYTGGFGVCALKGGAARVTNVESSSDALTLAMRNVELNGLNAAQVENVAGDVFQVLRQYRDSRREFDLIVLDPPKFAESMSQIESAGRGYKDINLLAFKLLRSGGVLFTFSCSGLLAPELFQKIVAGAALDAGREAQIIQRLAQAPDHPTLLSFPEGSYLKGLVCRVL
ncbi:MAG: 23S rRNA (cytosine(1962)-C(5))-methyltransferase RlmI [Nitrospirae bacterium CG08_land_8_20_14_0_20_52_24]|nr:MAG: 23S rRNA (cytosine(1962)-C(5))-methyltransferase RlmI [Nitrospirae bacterium CG08_land_8_20_14_0_20_52_24]